MPLICLVSFFINYCCWDEMLIVKTSKEDCKLSCRALVTWTAKYGSLFDVSCIGICAAVWSNCSLSD